jgi:hypothetical protein
MSDIHEALALETLDRLLPDAGLEAIALIVDHASDTNDSALTDKALAWCKQFESRLTTEQQRAILDYFHANAWANRHIERRSTAAEAWAWDQEELQKQIFYLRRARNNPAFTELPRFRKCQILTNLANQLNTAGRFIEARALWSEALREQPTFWMARANRGRGLMYYAHALYDEGHMAVLALNAHKDLTDSLLHIDEYPEFGDSSVRHVFATHASSIEKHFDLAEIEASYRPDRFALTEEGNERAYRTWCLQETLFLNPLNDLAPHAIAARDVLTLPNFVTKTNESPVLVGFFNQLKQEFVSARWLYFEGINAEETHFSDHDVLLYNTLDYPALGLDMEKVKISFRICYSLLDKIAYFLNYYLTLGHPEDRVSFRNVWREKGTGEVHCKFTASENWPFRGLYWLSKDLFEPDFKDMTDPESHALHDLRNHLEHKYVKTHSLTVPERPTKGGETGLFFDNLAYSVSRRDLERKTLRLLQLTRSALIYLSLGMHKEELRRRENAGPEAFAAPMPLFELDDERKRKW